MLLDPTNREILNEAASQGISANFIEAAVRSPIYKLAKLWKIALPLHPEYRTLPMVWYIPPLSPLSSDADVAEQTDVVDKLRIPITYLANLLTAGDKGPVRLALKRLLAIRQYMRSIRVENCVDEKAAESVGLTVEAVREMYHLLSLARLEERFVIPTAGPRGVEESFKAQGSCGYPDHV
jgi:nitrate reductase beta subunit